MVAPDRLLAMVRTRTTIIRVRPVVVAVPFITVLTQSVARAGLATAAHCLRPAAVVLVDWALALLGEAIRFLLPSSAPVLAAAVVAVATR